MSDFILPNRVLNLEDIFDMIEELPPHPELQGLVEQAQRKLSEADEASLDTVFPITGEPTKAREIVNYVYREVFFTGDIAAQAVAKEINSWNTAKDIWRYFHEYCICTYGVLSEIDRAVGEYGAYPKASRVNLCIYCRSTTNEFKSAEHVAPESLGNETSVLPRGYVCTPCNNLFSGLENKFVNTLPMSFLKLIAAVKVDKKGKLPFARYSKIHFEKTTPNSISIRGQAGKSSVISSAKLPNGELKLDVPDLTSEFDHIGCARTLVKIGLGTIAIEQGREVALEPRYDRVREFAVRGGTYPNWLFMKSKATPRMGFEVQWDTRVAGTTLFSANMFGAQLRMGFEIADYPFPTPDLLDRAETIVFDLRRTEKGPHYPSTETSRTISS